MNGSWFVKKSRRKSEHLHYLLRISFLDNLLFCFNVYVSHCFSLLSAFLSFKRFRKVQLKKENLKSVFWESEFGCPNWYAGLPNGLDMSLVKYIIAS